MPLSEHAASKLIHFQPKELTPEERDQLRTAGASEVEIGVLTQAGKCARSSPNPAIGAGTLKIILSWIYADLTDEDVNQICARQQARMPQPTKRRERVRPAKRWLKIILPPDMLFMHFFGRRPISDTDEMIRDRFTAMLLGTVMGDMDDGGESDLFLSEFYRRLGGLPSDKASLELTDQEIADAQARFDALLLKTSTAQLIARITGTAPPSEGDSSQGAASSATRTKTAPTIGTSIEPSE